MTESAPTGVSGRDRIALVVLGAVYLGYIVSWLFAVRANQLIGIDDRLQQAMANFGEFFAIVAPALWFFTVMIRVQKSSIRLMALAVGLLVLFPYPLFFGVYIP